jgi:uncharacterized protein (UPF0332 family)
MATWEEMSHDSFRAAQKLLAEGHLRSSVSRSYYAAYAVVSGELVRRGLTFAHGWNNPSHEQVAALIRNGLALPLNLRYQLNRAIRRLRIVREDADYRPGTTVDRRTALAAIHDANLIRQTLETSND